MPQIYAPQINTLRNSAALCEHVFDLYENFDVNPIAHNAPTGDRMTQNALLTFPEILDLTKYKSRSTIMRQVAAGTFPPPVKVGGNAIRWRQSDVMQWEGGLPPQRY